MSDTNVTTQDQPTDAMAAPLVRHARRESWGRAVMLWENEQKRGYQFEDGQMRVFAEGYYDLLQPARKPDPMLRHRLIQTARENGFVPTSTQKQGKAKSTAPSGPTPTLADQIEVFRNEFPDGFADEQWVHAYRARSGRRIKRLKDPAIAEAAQRLSKPVLDAMIEAGEYANVLASVVDVVKLTDLASAQQLAVFENLPVDRPLAEAMRDYLHDVASTDLEPMARLRRELARFGVKKIAWTALTAPRALLHPSDHMCVRPSIVRTQAKHGVARHAPGRQPNAADYSRALELAMAVREALTKAELAPRDLFDVTDFMWATLRPAQREKLQEAMVLRTSPKTAA